MLARKCDFCGEFYEHYDGRKHNEEKANAIIFIDRDFNDDYAEHNTYDLCPECMEKILNVKKEKEEGKNGSR